MMLSWVRRWSLQRRKRRALHGYVRQLGILLLKAYGREESYSVGRVRRTLQVQKLSVDFEQHAAAMFASKADFVAAYQGAVDPGDAPALYDELRDEVANLANDGSHRFMPKHWEDIGMHNGDDADAVSRWGIGL